MLAMAAICLFSAWELETLSQPILCELKGILYFSCLGTKEPFVVAVPEFPNEEAAKTERSHL